MGSWHFLTITTADRVTRITLDRPEKRNALGLHVMAELLRALRAVPEDTAVVVLGANGPAFSSGHDLSEMLDREAEFYDELFSVCTDLMLALHELPQPVIARVQGVATAAGCQLLAASDLRGAWGDIRSRSDGLEDLDRAFGRAGLFDRLHRVGARRHRRARHHLNRLAGAQDTGRHHGRNRIGGIMKPVHEIECQRQRYQKYQHFKTHGQPLQFQAGS